MGYPPNIRAAKRLFKILKLAQKSIPELMLVIVGRDPSAEILELENDSSVLVTGSVDNIWPYVKAIDLMVFPMETGSGQQNKLLESMAVGKPVISSALGNSGVGATHGKNIIIADSDEEFAQAICTLTQNPEQKEDLGAQAEQFVHSKYSWPSIFKQLEKSIFSLGTSQD
jgi:polysaccharide biosynthesis protein PslH